MSSLTQLQYDPWLITPNSCCIAFVNALTRAYMWRRNIVSELPMGPEAGDDRYITASRRQCGHVPPATCGRPHEHIWSVHAVRIPTPPHRDNQIPPTRDAIRFRYNAVCLCDVFFPASGMRNSVIVHSTALYDP